MWGGHSWLPTFTNGRQECPPHPRKRRIQLDGDCYTIGRRKKVPPWSRTAFMLRNTFCHLPGIGPRSEQKLWEAGVTSWADLLAQAQSPRSRPLRKTVAEHLEESLRHWQQRNPRYFADLLQANQHWRLFPDFRDSCAYL